MKATYENRDEHLFSVDQLMIHVYNFIKLQISTSDKENEANIYFLTEKRLTLTFDSRFMNGVV